MNKTASEAVSYIKELASQSQLDAVDVLLAVPYTCIASSAEAAEGTDILIGAQNMNDASEGAFTGEIAADMLLEAGARFVLLGHSERRHLFGETHLFINRKVHQAVQKGIIPILCVGETLEQRQQGQTAAVLTQQITESLEGLDSSQVDQLIVAYEPVWAIGTGETATPEMAEEAHAHCRGVIRELFGEAIADAISILYGGSVKATNATDLILQENIDGALVGGASLTVEAFAGIIQCDYTLPKPEIEEGEEERVEKIEVDEEEHS